MGVSGLYLNNLFVSVVGSGVFSPAYDAMFRRSVSINQKLAIPGFQHRSKTGDLIMIDRIIYEMKIVK